MSKDQALIKIRKLLAMAEKTSGATENEMITAMALARTLMLRHHLSPSRIHNFARLLSNYRPSSAN